MVVNASLSICYDKLWKLLIDKKMNRTELKEASGISFNVLARLGKNEPVSFESIEKICFTLNCKIEDVVEIQKEEPLQIDSDLHHIISCEPKQVFSHDIIRFSPFL